MIVDAFNILDNFISFIFYNHVDNNDDKFIFV